MLFRSEMIGGSIDGSIGRDSYSFMAASLLEEGLEIVGMTIVGLGLIHELSKRPYALERLTQTQ